MEMIHRIPRASRDSTIWYLANTTGGETPLVVADPEDLCIIGTPGAEKINAQNNLVALGGGEV